MPVKLQLYLIIGVCLLAIFLSLLVFSKTKSPVKQWRPLIKMTSP